MLNKTLLTGVSLAAAAGSMLAVAASAQTAPRSIYGGGSSLIAPYLRQSADCYSTKTTLKTKGNPTTYKTLDDFVYTGSPFQDCSTTKTIAGYLIDYVSASSGIGIQSFFSHDPSKLGDTDPASGDQFFPFVNYAASDTPLGTNEVNIYNNGGTNGTVGVTVAAPGATPGSGEYPNPNQRYGAMIQYPLLIAPVTIAFDPVYKKVRNADGTITEYSFNFSSPRADGSGGLKLSPKTACLIFNGSITNWNDARMTSQNGASLKDPNDPGTFDVPMQLVGRQDGSGTTSIFTRWLAATCPTSNAGANAFVDSSSRVPGTYVDQDGVTRTTPSGNGNRAGPLYNKANANDPVSGETPGLFTLADGSSGVAKYLDFTRAPGGNAGDTVTQGRIGYIGPDYVLPAVLNTGLNGYDLVTADVRNAAGGYRAPTPVNAYYAYTVQPPQSNADGTYNANTSDGRKRSNPQDWVEPASKNSPLANPSAAQAYPIVGTTNLLTYTCAVNGNVQNTKSGYLYFFESSKLVNDPSLGLLTQSGFFPLPNNWKKAIIETFLRNTNPSATALNLQIQTHGGQPQCQAKVGG